MGPYESINTFYEEMKQHFFSTSNLLEMLTTIQETLALRKVYKNFPKEIAKPNMFCPFHHPPVFRSPAGPVS